MAVRLLVLTALLIWGCAPPPGIYHTVQKGDTLYRISRTYDVDERYIARLNSIDDPNRIHVGQRLYIPGATQARTLPPVQRSAQRPAASSPPTSSRPPAASPPPVRSQTPPATPPRVVQSARPTAQKGIFEWPVRGRVIREFSTGGPSKGIEIATAAGTPVRSAAAGEVTYSGDGIRGYGNLIILKHDNSYFTVYGFNEKILVSNGAFVGKGDKIALSGIPPGGGDPRLHFEIRHGKTAVNPIFYLP